MYSKTMKESKSMINTNFRTVFISGGGMKKDSIGEGYKIINNALFNDDYWYTACVFIHT